MRRNAAQVRVINPDPIYGSTLVSKFVNCVMRDGKKSVAERIVYGALALLSERIGKNKDKRSEKEAETTLKAFEEALKNARPLVEVRSRRVGGSNYQVPIEVLPRRGNYLAMIALITAALKNSKKRGGMLQALANELLAAANNEGDAVRKRQEIHKMAEANRAFAHYARS